MDLLELTRGAGDECPLITRPPPGNAQRGPCDDPEAADPTPCRTLSHAGSEDPLEDLSLGGPRRAQKRGRARYGCPWGTPTKQSVNLVFE